MPSEEKSAAGASCGDDGFLLQDNRAGRKTERSK